MKPLPRITTSLLCVLLVVSCSKGKVRREATIGNETLQVVMPTGKEIVHPVHGKEVWFAVGAMSGEGKVKANGVAQAHVFADGETIVTVNLNIQPAPKGSHFVVWLQKPGSSSTERARLEAMQNPFHDVRHVVTAEIAKDLRTYSQVIVTREHDAGPSQDDPVQSTGTLKEQHR